MLKQVDVFFSFEFECSEWLVYRMNETERKLKGNNHLIFNPIRRGQP